MKVIDVVGAVILNESNQVLCALRSKNMSLPGKWEFPGGKVEVGETHKETVKREIREELSCEISVGPLITDCLHDYPNITIRLYTYDAQLISGQPIPHEHERLEWVDIASLADLDWAPADIPTVQRIMGDAANAT